MCPKWKPSETGYGQPGTTVDRRRETLLNTNLVVRVYVEKVFVYL